MVQFHQILKRLHDHQVEFVIIGGVAGALHGSPVATYDVDVMAPLDEVNLLRILAAVRDIHPTHRMRPDKLPLPDVIDHRLRGIRNLYLLTDLGILDILGELPEVGSFEELKSRSIEMDVGGFVCRVLDLDSLIATKKAANRLKDQASIHHLLAIRRMRNAEPMPPAK